MKNLRPPKFLDGLYRDMRDRRLLLPAIALVVALFAVPILLKSHSATSMPTVATSSGDRASAAAEPAVVAQQIGVTQYRKRLAELNSKNPFHQQYTTPPKAAQLHVTSTATGSATSTSTTPTTSTSTGTSSTSIGITSPSSSSTSSLPPVTGGTSSSVGSTTTSSPPSSSPASTVNQPKPAPRYFVYRVGVKVGEPGKLKDRAEVKRLTMLPSSNRPLATFLGVSEDGKQAVFQISADVDSVKGNGKCVPRPADCQYLALKAGDKVNLHYAPGNKRYNLVLTDIHPVIVGNSKPPGKAKAATASGQQLPKLGPG